MSSKSEGQAANLESLVTGGGADSKVEAGEQLLAFAEAAVGDDSAAIAAARQALEARLGQAAMVDAAGVIANFQRMVRIADGTGIPLDETMAMMSEGVRKDLGINDYSSAAHTPKLGIGKRIMGRLLSPFLPKLMARRFRTAPGESAEP